MSPRTNPPREFVPQPCFGRMAQGLGTFWELDAPSPQLLQGDGDRAELSSTSQLGSPPPQGFFLVGSIEARTIIMNEECAKPSQACCACCHSQGRCTSPKTTALA